MGFGTVGGVTVCGIAGLFGFRGAGSADSVRRLAARMGARLQHRGPDGEGCWIDFESECLLVHRRLAIVGLGDVGHQPMMSSKGRYVITYNGEIYNHQALRDGRSELRGVDWRGNADTETLLALIEALGVERAIGELDGMYAFAVYDRVDRALWLVRDRFGEKPLYWADLQGGLVFGSELPAVTQHPLFRKHLDGVALETYLRFGCVGGDRSIFRGVKKLPPGSWMRVSVLPQGTLLIKQSQYWSIDQTVTTRPVCRGHDHDASFTKGLEEVLVSSVKSRLMADVPVGLFLSGGIDSTVLSCLVREINAGPVSSFTIGFSDAQHNEAPFAREIARHLGLDHHELYVSDVIATDAVQSLPSVYDEPFADSSQLPTWLVSRLAASRVKVCLSGDGADELFGGYVRYAAYQRLWALMSWVPSWARKSVGTAMQRVPTRTWDRAYEGAVWMLPRSLRFSSAGTKVHKAARVFDAGGIAEFYERVSSLSEPSSYLNDSFASHENRTAVGLGDTKDPVGYMMEADLQSYLPNDLLVKVDRAAMNVSLETRMPFLSRDVVEYSRALPWPLLINKGLGKVVLRNLLKTRLPASLWDRPKQGFAIPLNSWLRGTLRTWAEELLAPTSLKDAGVFDTQVVADAWKAHQSGRADHGSALWPVLMFVGWARAQGLTQ